MEMDESAKKEWAGSCPTKVYKYVEPEGDMPGRAEVEEPLNCMFCDECKKCAIKLQVPDLVDVKMNEHRFIFTVETTGSLRPEEVVLSAIQVIKNKLEVVYDKLNSEEGGDNYN